jgi:quercetin dioxygenase-like cupin family protein
MNHRFGRPTVTAIVLAFTVATLGASAVGHDPSPEASPGASSAPEVGIVRTLLGETTPASAPGQTLSLWHYTIPPGEALEPHTHPGFQVAQVVSGTLTYTVISGTVTVQRSDGTTETASDGDVLTINAGDTVVENPMLAHFGANDGDVPVEIDAASLFITGSPPALPLASPGGSASPGPVTSSGSQD